ncbi:winged helix DNA-binding domain-containing protein [Subdoligranulum variabile]|uniref:Winged helix DNA-binding domain-containing protein n=1 Tax=Subdoligranulum variabile DSM 15176 TaxID=411471 RepID=D1PNZ2_9FIRM|nr:winged helix DNA-binding domain-containing protein [Subdoligranulum variabile]EFB75488.1 hypothetical protein SUBVAR_06106 [Subdoligranulum variabile DSM 15176]UWP68940.1 winged helix DNA-binding domain-containing protein [Subdoligranulum variabile]
MLSTVSVSSDQVRWYRLAAHHLDHRYPLDSLMEAAGVCGVQNSPPGTWETALFVRIRDVTAAQLRWKLETEKTLLQAWSFRGVPMVFPTAESPAFLESLAALPGEEPWIYTRGAALALNDLGMEWETALTLVRQTAVRLETCTIQSKQELDRFLAGEVDELLPVGLRERWNAPSPYGHPDRQTVGGAVVSFALRPCAFLGQVVFGARNGTHPTFTSPVHWLGHPLPSDPQAGAKLVRKFLHAYGPATPRTLADWLGSSPRQAKRLWQTVQQELIPVNKEGAKAWMLEQDLPALLHARPPQEPWRLVGAYDPYLDARDRALLLEDTALQRRVWRTVANPHVILQEGRAAGIWKTRTIRGHLDVTVEPFVPIPEEERQELARQLEEYTVFRGLELRNLQWKET